MRILFDTNVLIAGFVSRGHVFDILNDAMAKHDVYYTDFIMREFKKKLSDKFSLSKKTIAANAQIISTYFTKGITAISVAKVSRDPNDDQILADALANQIQILVSGDKDLTHLKQYKGIKIIQPRNYWNLGRQ